MAIRLHRLSWAERTALRLVKQYGVPSSIEVLLPGGPDPQRPGRMLPSQGSLTFQPSVLILSDLTNIEIPANIAFDKVILVPFSSFRPNLPQTAIPDEAWLGASVFLPIEGKQVKLYIKHSQFVRPNGNTILVRFFLGI
ncbi:putative portal [Achromobacter phage SE2]|nr:putative portal [Achromobacter phage SE2]